jgi:hypothetical protein
MHTYTAAVADTLTCSQPSLSYQELSTQADILRVLRTVTSHHAHLKPVYEDVSGHQDRYKPWWQLTLAEQLNCVCDGLAKATVFRSIQQLGSRKPFYNSLGAGSVFRLWCQAHFGRQQSCPVLSWRGRSACFLHCPTGYYGKEFQQRHRCFAGPKTVFTKWLGQPSTQF